MDLLLVCLVVIVRVRGGGAGLSCQREIEGAGR